MISAILQFYNGMRACVRLDDRMCSEWFAVEQGLRQGVHSRVPPFNTFFAAVINVTYTRFQGRKRHHGRFGAPEKEKGGGGAGGSNCRRVSPGCRFGACFMLTMPRSSRNHPSS